MSSTKKYYDPFGYEDPYFDDVSAPTITYGEPNPGANQPPPPVAPPPTGKYDLEGVRKGWAYGGNGFASNVTLADLDKFLTDNAGGYTAGVTRRGEKLYDPSGRFMFDAIGNFKSGDPNRMTRIALDHVGKGNKPRKGRPKNIKAPTYNTSNSGQSSNGGFSQPQSQNAPTSMDDIMAQLTKMFPDGMFNQDLVNSRTSSAADSLNRQRKSRMATNRAMLAERGLLGDGAELSTMNRMEGDLFDQFGGMVRDIQGDESQRADSRMMQALSTAAGLSSEQARLLIEQFRAENENNYNMGQLDLGRGRLDLDEMLGQGNLALGNMNAVNSYNLGLGSLGIDRDRLMWDMQNGDTSSLIKLLELYMSGAQTSAGGRI